MSIVGDHPESGVRFVLERTVDGAYAGTAFTPTERHAIRLDVAPDGAVTTAGDAPEDLLEKARLLVRTVLRHAASEGSEPPRRIVRWRA